MYDYEYNPMPLRRQSFLESWVIGWDLMLCRRTIPFCIRVHGFIHM